MRGAVKLLIGLGVVGALLVGADRLAVGVAEDQAADAVVSSGWMTTKPEVTIDDVPFLTHAVAGELDKVRLSSDGMTVTDGRERVTVHSFQAELSGVKFSDSYRSVTVGSGGARGLVSYADLAKFVSGGQLLGLEYGGPGKVKAAMPGGAIEGDLHAENNAVVVDNLQLTGMASLLKGVAQDRLKPQRLQLTGLPSGLTLSAASPQPDGVRLEFALSKGTRLGS
ncbi:DUF2993 domain-containing protein [Kitasatospora sp. NPDC049285]|uniref:LmeA family phospholipid-binding protein n=1 Tax=Kitasatospora sp. NPDC049285 TaxID=3157096 RepID=UPI00341AA494